jgi:hypothetical protein
MMVILRRFQAAVLSVPSAPQTFTPQQFYLHRLHHNPSHHSSSICTFCTTTLHATAVLSAPSAPQPFTPQQFYLHRLHHNPSHHSSSISTVCTTTIHKPAERCVIFDSRQHFKYEVITVWSR